MAEPAPANQTGKQEEMDRQWNRGQVPWEERRDEDPTGTGLTRGIKKKKED